MNQMPRRRAFSFAAAIVGADEAAERARICHLGFARAGRPSEAEWQRLKAEAMARAGLPWSERNDFELDHVIPRCLGGPNDLSNLQLQPWSEAQEKDHREAGKGGGRAGSSSLGLS